MVFLSEFWSVRCPMLLHLILEPKIMLSWNHLHFVLEQELMAIFPQLIERVWTLMRAVWRSGSWRSFDKGNASGHNTFCFTDNRPK